MATSFRPVLAWQPSFELDDMPLPTDACVRVWERGEGGRIAQCLAQGLLLPEDVSTFAEGTEESTGRRLQWHTIAVTSLSLYFSSSYTPITAVNTFHCHSLFFHLIRPLS